MMKLRKSIFTTYRSTAFAMACLPLLAACNGGGGSDGGAPVSNVQTAIDQAAQAASNQNQGTQPGNDGATQVPATGFLARSWSIFQSIDPNNGAIFPVAGLSADGAVIGAWVTNFTGKDGLETGSYANSASASAWKLDGLLPGSEGNLNFNNALYGYRQAAMDLAVSPNGNSIVAWISIDPVTHNTVLQFSTKSAQGAWKPSTAILRVASLPIKVVISNNGDAAIGYCGASGAEVVPYNAQSANIGSTIRVSKICSPTNQQSSTYATQFAKAFDLAIDAVGKIQSIGLLDSADVQGLTMVGMRSFTSSTISGSVTRISENLPASTDPAMSNFSVSYSQSPNGHAAVAWAQKGTHTKFDVMTRFYDGATWESISSVETSNDKDFILPEIAVNDSGEATLAMADPDASGGLYDLYVLQRGTNNMWTSPTNVYDSGYTAVQVATDSYGNGLLTMVDGSVSKFGILGKGGKWSGLKSLLPAGQSFGYRNFHYQTMRALPDGQAIIVVGTRYENGYISSGFSILK